MKRRDAWLMTAALLVAACSSSSKNSASTVAPSTTAAVVTTEIETATSATPDTEATDTTPTEKVPETVATDPVVTTDYSAQITRTSYGIPHIVADDWGSLGFGQGYASAEDRVCTLIDQIIKVRGERSLWFGPGEDNANIESDFAYRQLALAEHVDERFGDLADNLAAMVEGYVDGVNYELEVQGPHGWCEGEDWVQPITVNDLLAFLKDKSELGSSGNLLAPIAKAQPPEPAETTTTDAAQDSTLDSQAVEADVTFDFGTDLASNGWAIGSELSEGGGGMLLANPHFPWEGENRLWESQLTLTTGELNVYGATLSGVPGVLIGFNEDVAWTHTVSAGHRMTIYELTLVPGDPTAFVYGDSTEQMTSKDIEIFVKQDDGSIDTETRTMWSSHYGPIIDVFGWSTEKAYTFRDANVDNGDSIEQVLGMGAATSMDEFIDVHRNVNGISWVNTMATSADGRAWYADTAATPNLSAEALEAWQASVDAGGLAKTVMDNGAILLDGSNPINEWVDDPDAARPGILPFDQQPQLERADYIFNANDSHWLANPDELLTGYSPLTGAEGIPQSPRTRMNAILLADPEVRGDDGLFSLTDVQDAIFSNRGLPSELLLDAVIAACDAQPAPTVDLDGQPYDLQPACKALGGWDGLYNTDSTGAALWREFLFVLDYQPHYIDAGVLYSVPFDAADPVGTPNTLNPDHGPMFAALAEGAKRLSDGGFELDAPLGDMQFDGRLVDEHIPVSGGIYVDGTASIVECCAGSHTLAPAGDPGTFSGIWAFTERGYPVARGNSFMLTLEFTDDGPHAEALLTYGQPDDITSPDFISQMKLYSAETFRPVLYTDDEIAADTVSSITVAANKS